MAAADRVSRGANAIVTGGASGIGRALGERLAVLGAHVTIVDCQSDLAERVAAGISTTLGTQSTTIEEFARSL